jgi:hypothetical protein
MKKNVSNHVADKKGETHHYNLQQFIEQDGLTAEMIFRSYLNPKLLSRRILLAIVLTQEDGKPNNYVMRAVPPGFEDAMGIGKDFQSMIQFF